MRAHWLAGRERHRRSLLQNAHRIPRFTASFHQHCHVDGIPHSLIHRVQGLPFSVASGTKKEHIYLLSKVLEQWKKRLHPKKIPIGGQSVLGHTSPICLGPGWSLPMAFQKNIVLFLMVIVHGARESVRESCAGPAPCWRPGLM